MIASAIDGLPELDGTSLSLETLNGWAWVMGSQAGAEREALFLLQTFIVLEGANCHRGTDTHSWTQPWSLHATALMQQEEVPAVTTETQLLQVLPDRV